MPSPTTIATIAAARSIERHVDRERDRPGHEPRVVVHEAPGFGSGPRRRIHPRPPAQEPAGRALDHRVGGARAVADLAGDLVGEAEALMLDGLGHGRAAGDLVDDAPQLRARQQPRHDLVEQAALEQAGDRALDARAVEREHDEPLELRARQEPLGRALDDAVGEHAVREPVHGPGLLRAIDDVVEHLGGEHLVEHPLEHGALRDLARGGVDERAAERLASRCARSRGSPGRGRPRPRRPSRRAARRARRARAARRAR